MGWLWPCRSFWRAPSSTRLLPPRSVLQSLRAPVTTRITSAALACPSNVDPADNSCFRPQSLRELAGDGNVQLLLGYVPIVLSGYLGAVGKPDLRRWDVQQQHCDDADYLPPSIDPHYPQSRTFASIRLGSCLYFLAQQFRFGIGAADKMSDGEETLDVKQATIPQVAVISTRARAPPRPNAP